VAIEARPTAGLGFFVAGQAPFNLAEVFILAETRASLHLHSLWGIIPACTAVPEVFPG
jgi:hypothetical protein